jgi:tetratricopeptide (TPR) repeat protein
MQKILSLAAACSLISPLLAQAPERPPTANAHYQKGLAAEKASDPASAADHYRKALKLDPNHANARFSLGQLRITAGAMAAKGREEKFGSVIIPAFRLNDASLPEALSAFGLILERESNDEVAPNFVIHDPQNLLTNRKITLELKNMPSKGVMKYLLDQTRSKARYDEHAVVITPTP